MMTGKWMGEWRARRLSLWARLAAVFDPDLNISCWLVLWRGTLLLDIVSTCLKLFCFFLLEKFQIGLSCLKVPRLPKTASSSFLEHMTYAYRVIMRVMSMHVMFNS